MKLALVPIHPDPDRPELCSDACIGVATTEDGETICGVFRRSLDGARDSGRYERRPECLAATSAHDLQAAVVEAAKRVRDESHDSNAVVALLGAVDALRAAESKP